MSLILNEKYGAELFSYLLFISNRFLRLFPAYAIVLLLTLWLALMCRAFLHRQSCVSPSHGIRSRQSIGPSAALLIGSQIFMWGQDIYLFFTLKHGALAFWPRFYMAPQPLHPLLVIPQAWTLGLEFSFYLIAPFLVRRSIGVIMVAFASSLGVHPADSFGLATKAIHGHTAFFLPNLPFFSSERSAIGFTSYRQSPSTGDVEFPR